MEVKRFTACDKEQFEYVYNYCPYCFSMRTDAEFVDVGVGQVQCTPYSCVDCGAYQIGPNDTRPADEEEERSGWRKGWVPDDTVEWQAMLTHHKILIKKRNDEEKVRQVRHRLQGKIV